MVTAVEEPVKKVAAEEKPAAPRHEAFVLFTCKGPLVVHVSIPEQGRLQGVDAGKSPQQPSSERPFQVVSPYLARTDIALDSPVFLLLDEDHDSRLSADECLAAGSRLRDRDADDNEVVTLADCRRLSIDEPNRRRRTAGSSLAIEIQEWNLDSIYYVLSEIANFAIVPRLFKHLDADRSDTVEQQELSRLFSAAPDLHFEVDFGKVPPDPLPAVIRLKKMSDDLVAAGARADVHQDNVHITLPETEIDVFAADAPTVNSPAVQAKPLNSAATQIQVFVGEVQDPVFSWLDESRDGRLTSRELARSANRLTELDKDGDGFLAPEEFPQRIELRFTRGMPTTSMPQFGSTPAPRGPTTDVPGWMAAMDQNVDGEISRREFLGTPAQFAQRDANADGFIDAAEAK